MVHFILLLHVLWSDWVLSLRNVRSCGCLKMIFGTRPHGHHPRLCSFVIHSKLINQYDWKEVCVPSPSQVNTGDGTRLSSQDGVSQHQETTSLSLPRLNRLIEASFVWDEISDSNDDVTVIPSQLRVTQQILSHCQSFQDHPRQSWE